MATGAPPSPCASRRSRDGSDGPPLPDRNANDHVPCLFRLRDGSDGPPLPDRNANGHCAAVRSGGCGRGVAEQEAGAGAAVGRDIIGVVQRARVEAETAAADAAVELLLHRLEHRNPLVEYRLPRSSESGPVASVRGSTCRQRIERSPDLVQAQPHPLGDFDEPDPAHHVGPVPAVPGVGPLAGDQPVRLVEAQRRGRHARSPGHLSDGEGFRW